MQPERRPIISLRRLQILTCPAAAFSLGAATAGLRNKQAAQERSSPPPVPQVSTSPPCFWTGDEVIMPSYTFVSTANAVLRGAVPVFVDIREDTLNVDERLIEAARTPRTRANAPVHYAGVASEMDTILDIAWRHGLRVVGTKQQSSVTRRPPCFSRGVCELKQVDSLIITGMMNNANGQREIDLGYSFERTPRDAPAVWVRVDPASSLRDELAWVARTAGEPLRVAEARTVLTAYSAPTAPSRRAVDRAHCTQSADSTAAATPARLEVDQPRNLFAERDRTEAQQTEFLTKRPLRVGDDALAKARIFVIEDIRPRRPNVA